MRAGGEYLSKLMGLWYQLFTSGMFSTTFRSHVLAKVCQYFTYKVRYTNSSTEIPEFPISREIALELLMAANFLDCWRELVYHRTSFSWHYLWTSHHFMLHPLHAVCTVCHYCMTACYLWILILWFHWWPCAISCDVWSHTLHVKTINLFVPWP